MPNTTPDLSYRCLKTTEITFGFKLDNTSTLRTSIPAEHYRLGIAVKKRPHISMTPEAASPAPQTRRWLYPWIISPLFLYFLEIGCNG
jgi:hypothetical protein